VLKIERLSVKKSKHYVLKIQKFELKNPTFCVKNSRNFVLKSISVKNVHNFVLKYCIEKNMLKNFMLRSAENVC